MADVYLREGIEPWPHPLGRQDSIISIEQSRYAKLRHGSPFVTWAERKHTNDQNLGEDLFFGLHLILGSKTN